MGGARLAGALVALLALGADAAGGLFAPATIQAGGPGEEAPDLFPSERARLVDVDIARIAPLSADAAAADAKTAQVGVLRLNLFADAVYDAVIERRFRVAAGYGMRGRLVGVSAGRVTLAVRGQTVTGTILTPKSAYVIRPAGTGDQRHMVAEVDRSLFPQEDGQWQAPPPVNAPRALFDRNARAPVRASAARQKSSPAPTPLSRGHRESGVAAFGGRWRPQGPGPILYGQVENVRPDNEVVGAVHTVLAHPSNVNVLYVGATNGGIWMTENATAERPTWRPLTDHASSLSIGAMTFDSEDPQTILAGIGRYSSYGSAGGDRAGLLLTRDGGSTWREIRHPLLENQNVSGVSIRGDRLVVSIGPFAGGVVRSTDGGETWSQPEGLPPAQPAMDLVEDPGNTDRLYVSIRRRGVFRSDDGGANWQDVSDASLTAAFTATRNFQGRSGDNNNAELAVGVDGRVYAAVLIAGQAVYIGYSDDQGGAWTAMDLPRTLEAGDAIDGLNPRFKPGAQGAIHFSILVDPDDSDIVYVGGDRQNLHRIETEDSLSFSNSIGALNYTGRLFRGDAGVAATGQIPSPQWEHLTHRDDVATIPGGGTANSSSPHADSREMVFDAQGDIIQVDDGGVYRRTSPKDATGDWFSLNGDLQVSEMHNLAYDPLSDVIVAGNQDTGTPQQSQRNHPIWITVAGGDGGDVAVDLSEAPERSSRYSSFQFFRGFRRFVYDSDGGFVDLRLPALRVNDVSVFELDPIFGFTQNFSLNAVDHTRGVIGAASLYETFDRFETLTEVWSLSRAGLEFGSVTAYGCTDNLDLLYLGYYSGFAASGFISVRHNLGADGIPTADDMQPTSYPGGVVVDIEIDQDDCATVYAIDSTRVFASNDNGSTWRDITGNLAAAPVAYPDLRALEIIPADSLLGVDGALAIGSRAGVHVMFPHTEGVWFSMNDGLPHAPVWDLDYSQEDNAFFVSTLGRGAWRLESGPIASGRIADQTLEVADGAVALDLAGIFTASPDTDLVYAADSDNPVVASAAIVGGRVVVKPISAGEATIHVTATDANGLQGITTFTVLVGAAAQIQSTAVVREGEVLYLQVNLNRPVRQFTAVHYTITGDGNDATPDASANDYDSLGKLILVPGATALKIYLPITDDTVVEPPREHFKVTLVPPLPNPDFGISSRDTALVTINEGVCDRSSAVRDAISMGRHCSDVASVAAIARLDLSERGVAELKPLDFSGMRGLRQLDLAGNRLRALPPGVFNGLFNLRSLVLSGNQLMELAPDTFFQLFSLTGLWLDDNQLASLSPTLLYGNFGLATLDLGNNNLASLPASLLLSQSNLRYLALHDNRLDGLPVGFFAGLSNIGRLRLDGNPGAPFALNLELVRTDSDGNSLAPSPAQVALLVRQGAPFPIEAPLRVTGGVFEGNTTTPTPTMTVAAMATGALFGTPVVVAKLDTATVTTVEVTEAPSVPPGSCGLDSCYDGVRMAVGQSLTLFGDATTESNR